VLTEIRICKRGDNYLEIFYQNCYGLWNIADGNVNNVCYFAVKIMSAPGDYDDGETGGMIGRGNQSNRKKPATVPLYQPQTPHAARMRTRGLPRWEASD
jgi:hypothetical protein